MPTGPEDTVKRTKRNSRSRRSSRRRGPKIFISYRRDDSSGHAGRIHDRLEREFGRDFLFMDVDSVPLGINFISVLQSEVAKCEVLLAIIGTDWLGATDQDGHRRLDNPNDYVRVEIAAALQRDIPVIPILVEDAAIPRADQLPPDLAELAVRNGLSVRHASFHGDMQKLISGLARAETYRVNLEQTRSREIALPAAGGPSSPGNDQGPMLHGLPSRNPNFIGRTKLLQHIHDTLNSVAPTTVAVYGLGGIGKSSLAAEYAYQYAQEYTGVWWAMGDSRAVLLDGLAAFARILAPREYGGEVESRHASERDPDHEELVKAALARLATGGKPWLLVYDNVFRPEEVRGLIPSAGAHVLMTTRWPNWTGWAMPIPVDVFEPLEAIQLLLKITGRPGGQTAVRLAKTLGYLPLAIEQAGAYILDTAMPFSRYADRADELIAKAPKDAKYPTSVSATFNLAIERALGECPAAAKLLDFLSVLAPEQIPRDLIDDTILTEDDCDEALGALHRASLIKYEEERPETEDTPAIAVHRLVRAAMHQRLLAAGKVIDALRLAIGRLAAAFPEKSYSDPSCWPRCKQLLPHVLSLREEALHAKFESRELAVLIDGAANYLLGRGAFTDAEPLFNEVVQIGRRVLGPDHRDVGQWLNNCGNLYLNSGRYEEAKEKYFESISIGVKTLGRNDPAVATRLSNLAYALMKTGHYDEAEGYFREAIETSVKAYGRQDRRVAARLHKLAMLYHSTGRYEEAEKLYRESIAIGEATLGRDDILVCDWISDLANLLRDTSQYPEAERLIREAMANLSKVLGAEHHRIAFILSGLAELHLKMGRLDEAHQEALHALSLQKNAYGPDHRWSREAADVLSRISAAREDPQRRGQNALGVRQMRAG